MYKFTAMYHDEARHENYFAKRGVEVASSSDDDKLSRSASYHLR